MKRGQQSTVDQLDSEQLQTRKGSLKWLIFYMLAVIVVCLTAFNFYLFCWIWSSLGGGGGGLNDQRSVAGGVVGEWPRFNLISSWNEIQVEGRLSARSAVQVSELHNRADNAVLLISSPHSVQIVEDLQRNIEESNNHQESDDGVNQQPLLVVAKRQVQFPAGLQVSSLLQTDQSSPILPGHERISCDAAPGNECRLRAPVVRLTNQRGVDFDRKSVQTNLVETRRIHSATNSLSLLSPSSSLLNSSSSIELIALDELLLFSRNSSVSSVGSLYQPELRELFIRIATNKT